MQGWAFREQIVRPALKDTGLWSESAEDLLMGTAYAESGLRTVAQGGGGPALSFFQIEPITYYDVIRYLMWNKELMALILIACEMSSFPRVETLAWDMRLATLIARVKYWMSPRPLPKAGDVENLGLYWKEIYNTKLGAGTVEHFKLQWHHFEGEAHEVK